MKRFSHRIKPSLVCLLTYVLCASSILQPMAIYAVTAQAQQASSSEDETTTQDDATSQGDAAVDDSVADNTTVWTGDDANASRPDEDDAFGFDDGVDAGVDDDATVDEEPAEDVDTGAAVDSSSVANSWRYENGERRSDLQDDNAVDLSVDAQAMHSLPSNAKAQGIDVSGYQKNIDWQQVKNAGIDFAIIKIGNIDASENDGWYTDSCFQRNISECERLGIPYGVYAYSYAKSAGEAQNGANHVIALLKGHHPTLPVYIDLEDDSTLNYANGYKATSDHSANMNHLDYNASRSNQAAIARAFCDQVSAAGYTPGVYSGASWFKSILTDSCFSTSGWNIWTAQYWYGKSYNQALSESPQYPSKYDCWQYSSLATVPGISGNVDINYWYSSLSNNGGKQHVACTPHVANLGWLSRVQDGATAGTTGRSLALEALKVEVINAEYSGSVQINAHVSDIGWQGWKTSTGGTTGQAKQMEAVRLQLTGDLAQHYDIYYRVHAADFGWMGWAKNGESAGSEGYAKRLEAVQVVLVKKGQSGPTSKGDVSYAFKKKPMSIGVTAHVANLGWRSRVENGATAGTTGRALALEALKVEVLNAEYSGSVEINAHVADIGWQGYSSPSASMGGTTGRAKQMEAVQLRLTGELAQKYDIWYRVHAADFGWMGWAKNGESAGSEGYAKRLEAVQVVLVKKGQSGPTSKGDVSYAFKKKPMSIGVTAHVANLGWRSRVENGATAGTTGRALALEALKVEVLNAEYSGSVEINAHVADIGWQGYSSPSASMGGTTGRAKQMEAVQLRLTGELAQKYDIWYRVHAADFGWMGWAKNGESAGSEGCAKRLEAVQVVLVKKGGSAPGSTDTPFVTPPSVSYSSLVNSSWQGNAKDGATSGTTGRSTPIRALSIGASSTLAGSVSYSVHLSNLGWQGAVSNGAKTGSLNGSQAVQAIKIQLTGTMSTYFDIYYRVHVDNFGWLGWAKNGSPAGTTSCSINVQAYQVKIVRKGGAAPGGGTAYYSSTKGLPYIGYQNPSPYYQVSNQSVTIKNQGNGRFGYRTESRISYNATRNQLVEAMISRAYDYVGTTPYIWDYSCAPGIGVDCAGLVMQCLYATGMNLGRYNPWDHYYTPGHNHYANDMWNDSRFKHVSFSERQRGDLICYPGHIAIYLGNDQIIEANSPAVGVRVHSVYIGSSIRGCLRPFV